MTGDCVYLDQLRSVVQATTFHSLVSYSWMGKRSQVLPSKVAGAMTPKTARDYLQTQLQSHLYADFYICGAARSLVWTDEASVGSELLLVEQLSAANCGTGCKEDGWEVVAMASGQIAVRRNRLTLYVGLDDVSVNEGAYVSVGSKVALRLQKELRKVSPGYYFALSDRSNPHGADAPLVRLYWNVKAQGAPLLMQGITRALNENGFFFSLKLLNHPALYSRCDAGVLYFHPRDYPQIRELLRPVYQRLQDLLKPRVPALTKAIAPGLGLAEDPIGGESFGQHRCRMVAHALICAHEEGADTIQDRLRVVSERLLESGVNIQTPFLNAGSTDHYDLLREPTDV